MINFALIECVAHELHELVPSDVRTCEWSDDDIDMVLFAIMNAADTLADLAVEIARNSRVEEE